MRQKDDKKIEQIFEAALLQVEKKGLAGMTMSDISKAAGIATGTLYIYFKNKEDLISGLFTQCRKESANFYFRDYDSSEPFKKGFEKIFLNITNYRLLHFRKAIFLDQCFHSPYINESKRLLSAKVLQPLFQLFETGKAKGIIKEGENRFLLWYIIGCINEVVKGCYYSNKKLTREMINDLLKMCWDGLRKKNNTN